jgi:hypothetical protein
MTSTPHPLLKRLIALAGEVEAAWAASAPSDHPQIAADALARARIHDGLTLDDLFAALLTAPFPRQIDPAGAFGDPPFTLYFSDRLALDLYFWHQPEVAIHNHAFRGAFAVLLGHSLHLTYRFAPSPATSYDGLAFGALDPIASDVLQPGDAVQILPGMAFIHQVCHLASPCASLVLRSPPDDPADHGHPIYDLLRPNCALIQAHHLTQRQHKRLALAALLQRHQRADLLHDLLDAAPDAELAWALRQAAHRAQDPAAARALASGLTPRPWFAPFIAAVEANDRALVSWATLTDPGRRLAALLLWLEPDPDARDRLSQRLTPGLAFQDRLHQWVADTGCTDLLGVPLPREGGWVLSALLDGCDDAETCRRVASRHGDAPPEVFAPFVSQMRAVFSAHPLLAQAIP